MDNTVTGGLDFLGDSFQTLADNMLLAIGEIVPIALTVGGAVLVILLGWKLFKRLTK